MSPHASTRRARLQLEPLEDRCTPSALLGDPWAHAPAPAGQPPAHAAARVVGARRHAVSIKFSTHITSDGSGGLSYTGVGTLLGRWTGQGGIDNVVIDPVGDRGAIAGRATIIAANGAQLLASFSGSWKLTTGLGK